MIRSEYDLRPSTGVRSTYVYGGSPLSPRHSRTHIQAISDRLVGAHDELHAERYMHAAWRVVHAAMWAPWWAPNDQFEYRLDRLARLSTSAHSARELSLGLVLVLLRL